MSAPPPPVSCPTDAWVTKYVLAEVILAKLVRKREQEGQLACSLRGRSHPVQGLTHS